MNAHSLRSNCVPMRVNLTCKWDTTRERPNQGMEVRKYSHFLLIINWFKYIFFRFRQLSSYVSEQFLDTQITFLLNTLRLSPVITFLFKKQHEKNKIIIFFSYFVLNLNLHTKFFFLINCEFFSLIFCFMCGMLNKERII